MLAALLLQPERAFGTNELIAIGGAGVGAGRNIVEAFEKAGIVANQRRGNQLLYSINRAHPLYSDLRSICMKTFGLADVVTEELQPFRDRIKLAFIFGSIARGSERPDSDVDLMVVGDVDVFELGPALENLQKTLGRDVALCLYTRNEWKNVAGDQVITAIMRGDRMMVVDNHL
ncbi:nucleotidyltransferase family protein [Rhizobium laguerreae]|uniref:nucleotidyltransferase family protein n=1 Tax=Rhizobium laguerreae TaxID=1076926 RepID=UPI001FEB8FEC|nr:nucleotidyltransferase domain-containing protein [Rhizobium laguerreae]